MEKLLEKLDQLLTLQAQVFEMVKALQSHKNQNRWLDAAEVKMMLKISTSTLYRYKRKGILTPYTIQGKEYYSAQNIDKVINNITTIVQA